jgi:bacterioferritin-associated ferredoxin
VNVCICAGVREERIVEAIHAGSASLDELQKACGAGTGCGDCTEMLIDLLEEYAPLGAYEKQNLPKAATDAD